MIPLLCTSWIVKITGAEGTLYQGEQFRLQFKFLDMYPMEAPEVGSLL
jgi:ubiquitin-conjugating enzyme E2 W